MMSDPAEVVDFLPGFQHPAQLCLDHHPVLVDPAVKTSGVLRDPYYHVPVRVDTLVSAVPA